jgi:hypothetical protein
LFSLEPAVDRCFGLSGMVHVRGLWRKSGEVLKRGARRPSHGVAPGIVGRRLREDCRRSRHPDAAQATPDNDRWKADTPGTRKIRGTGTSDRIPAGLPAGNFFLAFVQHFDVKNVSGTLSDPISAKAATPMSNPAASNGARPPVDPEIGLMITIADQLIPLFQTGSIDTKLARRMSISAINAYQPECRADLVNIARTIAFSIAALGLLGKATAADMPLPVQMRTFGRAVALNRSADQSERTMMQRRRYRKANRRAEQPDHGYEPPDPDPQISDAEMQAEVANIMREHRAACPPAGTDAAAPVIQQAPVVRQTPVVRQAPAAPNTGAPRLPVAIPATAIHYAGPKSGSGQPRTAPFRQELLRRTAMERVIGQSDTRHPL